MTTFISVISLLLGTGVALSFLINDYWDSQFIELEFFNFIMNSLPFRCYVFSVFLRIFIHIDVINKVKVETKYLLLTSYLMMISAAVIFFILTTNYDGILNTTVMSNLFLIFLDLLIFKKAYGQSEFKNLLLNEMSIYEYDALCLKYFIYAFVPVVLSNNSTSEINCLCIVLFIMPIIEILLNTSIIIRRIYNAGALIFGIICYLNSLSTAYQYYPLNTEIGIVMPALSLLQTFKNLKKYTIYASFAVFVAFCIAQIVHYSILLPSLVYLSLPLGISIIVAILWKISLKAVFIVLKPGFVLLLTVIAISWDPDYFSGIFVLFAIFISYFLEANSKSLSNLNWNFIILQAGKLVYTAFFVYSSVFFVSLAYLGFDFVKDLIISATKKPKFVIPALIGNILLYSVFYFYLVPPYPNNNGTFACWVPIAVLEFFEIQNMVEVNKKESKEGIIGENIKDDYKDISSIEPVIET